MADAKRVDPIYGFTQLNHRQKPDIARRYLNRLCAVIRYCCLFRRLIDFIRGMWLSVVRPAWGVGWYLDRNQTNCSNLFLMISNGADVGSGAGESFPYFGSALPL